MTSKKSAWKHYRLPLEAFYPRYLTVPSQMPIKRISVKKNHATSLKYPHVLILEKVFVSLFYMESLHCHFSLCFMSVSVYAPVYGWLCAWVCAWKNPDHIKRHKTYPATENTHTDTDNFQRHQVKSHSNMKQTDSNHFRLNINHTGLK